MTEPALKRAKPNGEAAVTAFQCPAQAVFTFHLLVSTSKQALEAEIAAGGAEFEGEFFHQHFEEEVIRGFEGLRVNVWVSAVTFHTWIDIKWSKRRPGADKIKEIMAENFPKACASKEALISEVVDTLKQADGQLAGGEVMDTMDIPSQGQVTFYRFQLASQDPRNAFVKALHERLQPLLLFFIDGASLVDSDDPKWELLLAVHPATAGGHVVMGMQTLYNFWAYPERGSRHSCSIKGPLSFPADFPSRSPAPAPGSEHGQGQPAAQGSGSEAQPAGPAGCDQQQQQPAGAQLDVKDYQRLRLSQSLVLPPYQGVGIGKRLLALAYRMAVTRNCLDLTLEDPSPNMNRMREKLEVEVLMGQPWVMEEVKQVLSRCSQGPAPNLALPSRLALRVKDELKIHRKQLRLVWEALLFLQPALKASSGARAALEKLIRARVDMESFGPCGAEAEVKKIHDARTNPKVKNQDATPFVMMRTKKEAAPPDGAAASSSSEVAPAEQSATGRLSVVMMSTQEKEEALQQQVDERLEQLETLARLLRPRAHAGQLEGREAGAGDKGAERAKVAAHVLAEAE